MKNQYELWDKKRARFAKTPDIDPVKGSSLPPGREAVVSVACGGRAGARRADPLSSPGTMCRRRGNSVVKIGEGLPFERAHDSFERPDHIVIFRGDQCERVARTLGASRAPNAMDVGIRGIGHIVVNDVRDVFHVETARRDIGGHHDLKMAGLEAFEGLLTLTLRAIAMQACDTKASMRDLPGNLIGAMLGTSEDQH